MPASLSPGKQARVANINDEAPRKEDAPQAPHPVQDRNMHASEPAYGHMPAQQEPLDAYSQGPGDAHNRAVQAGFAAAHHVEHAQPAAAKGTKTKRVDEAELKQLVAEENASRAKFPRYPGLERWELIEKMGDGAFSNVYRARDLQGGTGEVAIKVVRKYEMNSMQVSVCWASCRPVSVLSALPRSFSVQCLPRLRYACVSFPAA